MKPIILASASPRRLELVRMLNLSNLTVRPAVSDECPPAGASPVETAKALSLQKAEEVYRLSSPSSLVIAADTAVWLDGRMLGKPRSEDEAFTMLRSLSGRSHLVCTGVTLLDSDGPLTEAETTLVSFRPLTDGEIRAYIATGEPMDKAGAYGAQGRGALFVRSLQGDFFNVMGLPVCLLGQMLNAKGVPVL